MDRSLLQRKSLAELREIASTLELRGYQRIRKADLIDLILEAGAAASAAPAAPETSQDADASDQPEPAQPEPEQQAGIAWVTGHLAAHRDRGGVAPAGLDHHLQQP